MALPRLKVYSKSLRLQNSFNEITIDLQAGTFSGKNRKTRTLVFKDAAFRVDESIAAGGGWKRAENKISWRQKSGSNIFGNYLDCILTFKPLEGYEPIRILTIRLFEKQPFIEFLWAVKNPFDYPIRIRDVEVLYGGELFVGQKLSKPQVLRSGAGAEANMVEKGWELSANNGMLLTYRNGQKRQSIVAGGLKYKEFARRVETLDGERQLGVRGTANTKNEGFRNLTIACWDPYGKTIAPRKTYNCPDSSYLDMVTEDPFEALEAYGDALQLANKAKPNLYDFPTLCGWMVSTKHLGENKPINNSPGLVEQTRIAKERGFMNYSPLAVRLEPDTYCYNNFGDTQQGWWDDKHWRMYGPGGGMKPDPNKASLQKPYDSFKKFCEAVKELGGIPFTYFQSSMPSNDFAKAHPEWMLNNDISELHMGHAHHRPWVRYDYSDPGFREHCLKTWTRLRKDGLQGIKFDYPESAWNPDGGFEDDSFTTTSAYAEMYRLCRKGLGKNAYIHERNLGGITHEYAPRLDVTAGVVDLQRVWGDASHFEPEMASRMGLRWYKSRKVFIYYPDGKSFHSDGKALAAYKRQAFLTLIAFLGGRLEIGTSIGSMTDEMFHDTTRLYPMIDGAKSPRPVDMFMDKKHPEVYMYDVNDDWCQVLLVNNNKSGRKEIAVAISADMIEKGGLNLDARESYHVFDFWSQSYQGLHKGSAKIKIKLRGGEVAMLSVRRKQDHPQVLSTNRHIMQGMMECHDMRWDGRRKILSGKVDVVAGEEFILTVAGNGLKAKRCEGAEIRIRKDAKGIVDLVFNRSKNKRMSFKLQF